MRHIVLTALILAGAVACFGQSGRTYSSPAGFGNVIYPGTGHAPNAPALGTPRQIGRIYGYPAYAPRVNHPAHGRSSVVPYPVIVGGGYGYPGYGFGGGFDGPPQGYPQEGAPPTIVNTNSVPSVVINQTFIPDRAVPMVRDYNNGPDAAPPPEPSGMHVYEGLKTTPHPSDQATIYLIAFKDHRIVPALGYWIEGGNLHYVSAEHSLNVASLDLIDRDLSQQLNDERNVEFRIPKAQ